MRSNGVGAAGGVGEVIADYITEGNTKFDMYYLYIARPSVIAQVAFY